MAQANLACSNCGNEAVQKESAVYLGGTWAGSYGGPTVTYGRDSQGKSVVSTGYSAFSGGGASYLAGLLAPPSKPSRKIGWRVVGLLFTILYGPFAFIVLGIYAIVPGTLPGFLEGFRGYTSPFWLLFYATCSYLFYRLYRSIRTTLSEYPDKLARWEGKMRRWNQIFYCPKCDSVFHPETREHAPVREVGRFLDMSEK